MENNKLNIKNFHDLEVSEFDAIIVGSGFAGSVCARELAEHGGKKVLIIEKRDHIAGNMFDEYDKNGVLVHKYGPHIFHTNSKQAADYLRRFCNERIYEHRVKADINGMYIPVPFNKTSMEKVFGLEKANLLTRKLIKKYGNEVKVTINQLLQEKNNDLREVANYVYENVFLKYTMKQWGLRPEEVDPEITSRVPIFISRDDRYFQDSFQFMPKDGYTNLFENMLSHKNITIALNTEAESVFGLIFEGDEAEDKVDHITIQYKRFDKPIIYTGPLDELFMWRHGRLPYRSLDFKFENYNKEYMFPCGTINYTVSEDYTRITEYKHLTGQKCPNTTIMKEYSKPYEDVSTQIPYYAIINKKNLEHYNKYKNLVSEMDNFYAIGRLAEYKYYNMDQIIDRALDLSKKILL